MKYIEFVEEYMPAAGLEYNIPLYPKTGIYRTPNIGYLLVIKEASSYFMIGNNIPFNDSIPVVNQSGLSEDFFLKALAVSQQPELALTLVKGN